MSHLPGSPAEGPRESSRNWRRPVPALAGVALLATFLGYGWTLDGYFQGDDFAHLNRYFDFPFARWPSLFLHGWVDGLWVRNLRELRPVNALAFIVDAKVWGLNPLGFRLTNLLLHAGCAALVGLIAWRATSRHLGSALAATLFFALHPVNAHAVAWITGRVDVLCTLFYLGAFLSFLRFRQDESTARAPLWILALCFAGALLTKEAALALPGLLLVADLVWLDGRRRWRERSTWLPYLACAVVLAIYLAFRHAAFGVAGPSGVGRGLPDLTGGSFYFELARRQGAYLAHLFPPAQSWLYDWRDAIFTLATPHPRLAGLLAAVTLVAALGAAGYAFWLALTRRTLREDGRATVFFCVGWYLVATLPLMMTYYSPRHLYPAVAGLAVVLALLLRRVARSRGLAILAVAACVGLYGQQLVVTLRPWHEAARISGAVAREVAAAALEAPAGSPLMIDVPADLGAGCFCWSWAVPYALRPPFQQQRLDQERLAIAAPGAYAFDGQWYRPALISRLLNASEPGWLVYRTQRRRVTRILIPAEKIRGAARHLVDATPETEEAAWRHFIADLRPPRPNRQQVP